METERGVCYDNTLSRNKGCILIVVNKSRIATLTLKYFLIWAGIYDAFVAGNVRLVLEVAAASKPLQSNKGC